MERKILLVFKYESKKRFYYTPIDSIECNDGRSICNVTGACSYGSKLGVGSSGAIHEVTETDEGVRYNAKALPVAFWKNEDDRSSWRLKQTADELDKKTMAEGKVNLLEKQLAPLAQAYAGTNARERALMLAEIIRIVTKGRLL